MTTPTTATGKANLWIIGTSVSIEHGGYVSRLQALAPEAGFALQNLSVGDQTSVMGCMRVFAHLSEFRRGDVVVWEYSLLDHLLTQGQFRVSDVVAARRLAWNRLQTLGVAVIVLMCPPRSQLDRNTTAERVARADAERIGQPSIDLRRIFAGLGIRDAHLHYRDDRHPLIDSPVVEAMAAAVLRTAELLRQRPPHHPALLPTPDWHWLDLADQGVLASAQTFTNALMTVPARRLEVDQEIALPHTRRVVALGVVSEHASGGAWCGHPECPPVSTRLPADLGYAFLLRASAIACTRARVDRIVSAPDWAYRNGYLRSYGQALSNEPGRIAVFGALIEAEARATPAGSTLKRWRDRWFRRRTDFAN